jgi:hypothetical protein
MTKLCLFHPRPQFFVVDFSTQTIFSLELSYVGLVRCIVRLTNRRFQRMTAGSTQRNRRVKAIYAPSPLHGIVDFNLVHTAGNKPVGVCSCNTHLCSCWIPAAAVLVEKLLPRHHGFLGAEQMLPHIDCDPSYSSRLHITLFYSNSNSKYYE